MDIDTEEHASERVELHFLAAQADELMKALMASGVISRDQIQEVENAASQRIGMKPRAW